MKYNTDVEQFCIDSMTYKGKQYGITYYTDFMGFIVNDAMLEKAGIKNAPTTWAEVREQAKLIKSKGLIEYPILVGMAQETWVIEFMSALVFSHGGRFTDDGRQRSHAGSQGRRGRSADHVGRLRHKDKTLSPSCVETGELAGLKSLPVGPACFRSHSEISPAHAQ